MKKLVASLLAMSVILLVGCTNSGGNSGGENSTANFSSQPLKIIVPTGAGGGNDILARILSQGGQKYFGQPINIVNRDGAGGTIATTEFLREKGDGHTILFGANPFFTSQPKMNDVRYKQDDFKSVIGLTDDAIFLTTHKDAPFQTVEEMIAYGKDNIVKFGFTGAGGLLHISQEALYSETGIQNVGISVSGGESTSSLLGGHIDVIALHAINIKGNEEAGSFIPMAVFSDERSEIYPDVPTIKELGYDLVFDIWKFLLVPSDTPDETVDILYEGFNNIINDPELRKNIENTGTIIIEDNSGEVVTERLAKDIISIGEQIDTLGMSKN